MAFEYQNFASLGVNLNRQKYGPLDISNVFTSENDLRYYLTKGAHTEGVSKYWYESADKKVVPYPYEGQVLATVIDGEVNVYVLAAKEDGTFETREIAGKIEVDGTTIVKDADGKLSIVAPVDPDTSKSYNFTYANGVYSWVAVDTATAAGQAQAIEGLTTRTATLEAGLAAETAAREAAIGKATEGEVAATGVYAAIEAAEARAKAYADENDTNTVYDDNAVKGRLDVIERDYLKIADKYNDSELRAAITELDTAIGDSEGGLVKDVADNKQAIADEKVRAEAAEKALGERISAIDFVDTAELEDAIKDFATVAYVDGEVDKLEAAIASLNHFKAEVVTNKAEMKDPGVLYLFKIDSATGSDVYEEYIVVDGVATLIGDTTTDLSNYYNKTEVDGLVEVINNAIAGETEARGKLADRVAALETADETLTANIAEVAGNLETTNDTLAGKVDSTAFDTFKTENTSAIATAKSEAIEAARLAEEAKKYAVASDVERDYLTKADFETHEAEITNDLLTYAKTEYVNTELAKKIESGSIAHSTEELAEGVTVEGTALKIVVDAYTKAEARQYVADTIKTMTGGESAADVKLLLENHVANYNEKVGQIEAHAAEQDTAIAAAKTQADKGVADAKKVSDDLVTANGLIAGNTREINTVKDTITTVNETLSGKVTALENKDTEIAGLISGLDTTTKTNSAAIGEHAGKISALENKDIELASLINTVDGKFANYYDKDSVDAMVKAVDEAVKAINLDPYATTTYVDGEVDTLEAAIATKADASALANYYTKTEADAEFMTETEVKATVDAVVAAAVDTDTLEGLAQLVTYVHDNAGDIAKLVTDVATNKTAHEKNAQDIATHDAAITRIDGALAAIVQPKESDEISVAADGTLGVKGLNVNKLVQTEGDILILDGGSAGVKAAE